MTTQTLTPKQKKELRVKPFHTLSMEEKYSLYDIKKIGYLDIECTNLKANFGFMLSWSMRVRDVSKKNSKEFFETLDPREIERAKRQDKVDIDKELVKSIYGTIEKEGVDLLIGQYFHGWNKMDVPFIRTRAAMCGLFDSIPSYRQIKYGDCWKMAHMTMSSNSYRLETIAEVLGLPEEKTPVTKKYWLLGTLGQEKALDYILDHNRKDVIITEGCHRKLERLVSIPASYV